MRNYKLTFFLAGLLMISAFAAQYYEMKKPKGIQNDTLPWVLFGGGMVLMLVGTREYRQEMKEKE